MGNNVFDLIVAGLLAWSVYKGFSKGLISAAASLAALLLGVWGAVKFSGVTSSYLSGVISVDEKVLGIISFAITFILIVIGIHFIAKTLENLARAVALGFVNKLFGAVFGLIKTAFIISVVLVIVNAVDTKMGFITPEFKENSLFYKPLSSFSTKVFDYLKFDKYDTNKPEIDI